MSERAAIIASIETNVCIGDTLVRLHVLEGSTVVSASFLIQSRRADREVWEHENTHCDKVIQSTRRHRWQSHPPRLSNPVLSEAASGFVDNNGQVKWIAPRGRISLPG
jgi:hypothetical protein